MAGRRLEELTGDELARLDEQIAARIALYGSRAFSESSGRSGRVNYDNLRLMTERLIQLNQQREGE